jgi:F-type H+-transporting ATPase subunit c
MKKIGALWLLLVVFGLLASPVLAQAPAKEHPPERVASSIAIASGFSMAIAAAFCGIGQSRVASAACEGLARNPGAAAAIRLSMILGLVFIETLALFTLAIVFAKVTY